MAHAMPSAWRRALPSLRERARLLRALRVGGTGPVVHLGE
jgi:hypothetical protein